MLPEMRLGSKTTKYWIDRLLNNPISQDDGETNAYGSEIIKLINRFMALSYCLVVGLISFSKAFEDLPQIWEIDETFAAYKVDYSYGRIGRMINRMCHSLIVQRKLMSLIKAKVNHNRLSKAWYEFLKRDLELTLKRPDQIMFVLQEDLKMTPFVLYNEYLSRKKISFLQDMVNVISRTNRGSMFGLDYDLCSQAVMEHIKKVFTECAKDSVLLNKAKFSAIFYMKAVAQRTQQRKEEKEKEAEMIVESKKKDALEYLYGVSRNVSSLYKSRYSVKFIDKLVNSYNVFYIVGVVKICKNSYDFPRQVVYLHDEKSTCLDIGKAFRYSSEDDAQRAKKKLLEKHPAYAAEVINVDLHLVV